MKNIFFIAASALLIAFSSHARTDRDITYYDGKDPYAIERCKLDISAPDTASNAPVVVWFHGGGLTGGKKHIPARLADAGYIVIAPNYRLMPSVPIDSCIDDAARAVAWAFANAERLGGSPRKIFVAGHSAGGYLTAMIGLDRSWLRKYGVEADSIAALIPYSGQMITHFAHRDSQGIPALQATVDRYAPLYHVRADAPPFIMITGDPEEELYGRYEENAYMWRMMRLTGHPDTEIYRLDGYNHGDMAQPAHHILRKTVRRIAPTTR
ncbi:MAG: alpha/beta hydrolase [Muribaculaceae bacterium]|nr:alpha/beta hydrolase [Muribaculaceae bacterium]